MVAELSRGLVISDFNADNLAALLNQTEDAPALQVIPATFGQVYQLLADGGHPLWAEEPGFALVWTRPEGVIRAFQAALDYEQPPVSAILEEVDAYAALLQEAAPRVKALLVPTWTLPAYHRGYGLLDMRPGLGLAHLLMEMNLRLAQRLEGAGNMYLLDSQRWIEAAGWRSTPPKLWYMGKIAFGSEVVKQAALDIKASLQALAGRTRKLIVLDLDNTLWGGIVGDEGWENLVLGGHSPAGEAFLDFQRLLKALTRRGILLGIVSKNGEAVALEAIEKHPEMFLSLDDFAGWRINWGDKAQNLADLAHELNLGLDAVVFLDDNPVERARVAEMFPEVLVPDWPEDKTRYKQALLSLTCFDSPVLSQEDSRRTQMYVTERKRSALKAQAGSLDDWLVGLEIQVSAGLLDETNLPRAAQLFNKTNQMNLATRRMSAEELSAWAARPDNQVWVLRVADRFGDSGLTGILGLHLQPGRVEITDFVLSCRVMGRKVEETMAALAVQIARRHGASQVRAVYHPTDRNRPCLEFWERSGFACQNQVEFTWEASQEYPVPGPVRFSLENQPAAHDA